MDPAIPPNGNLPINMNDGGRGEAVEPGGRGVAVGADFLAVEKISTKPKFGDGPILQDTQPFDTKTVNAAIPIVFALMVEIR